MRREQKQDEFFHRQPPLTFIEELTSPVHDKVKPEFGFAAKKEDEADVSGMYLIIDRFDNKEGLLDTSFDDFSHFITVYGIKGTRYPLTIKRGSTRCFEAYTVIVTENKCDIIANDTEGVRRALIYIEDEIQRREGAFLPRGETERYPRILTRITRGFFSPTNRPPKCIDELCDDVDYYPDEYLNRLMHDGINGIWIYTRFSKLLTSSFITEYGEESEKQMSKLKNVIKKCARFGIKVYVFAIEPFMFRDDNYLNEKYKDILGAEIEGGYRAICTSTEFVRQYLEEATKTLFREVPNLGGWISITVGEGLTSCVSNVIKKPCPRCGGHPKGKILAETAEVMQRGIRKTKADADFVSWTYAHRLWSFEDIEEYVENAPADCVLMQNFEDMGYEEQLGAVRQGADYWLSYVGPSPLFEITAKKAMESGKRMWAKLQVCCSHELASVPYIPVPGILFKKYAAAYKYNVEGVVQCWYFGNYPSLMSKAAGELAFEHDFENEDDFLYRLAALYWGESKAQQVVKAWKYFEEGYRNYPLNIMFSYYGPMHDGVVWELHLKPKNFSLPRTWLLLDRTDGDRIGECLMEGHTIDEAITLADRITESWGKGLAELEKISRGNSEQLSIAYALDVLFKSGRNILRFYRLRELLGYGEGNPAEIISEIKEIIEREKKLSAQMCKLCEKDGRLGYHSEAEGYKFFPEKLKYRIKSLKELKDEIAEVEKRVAAGLPPLEYYMGVEEGSAHYKMEWELEAAAWAEIGGGAFFRVAYDSENLYLNFKCDHETEFLISPEFRLMFPSPSVGITSGGEIRLVSSAIHNSIFGEREAAWLSKWKVETAGHSILVTLKREEIGWVHEGPIKMRFKTSGGELWCYEEEPVYTLGKADVSPGEFGWLMP